VNTTGEIDFLSFNLSRVIALFENLVINQNSYYTVHVCYKCMIHTNNFFFRDLFIRILCLCIGLHLLGKQSDDVLLKNKVMEIIPWKINSHALKKLNKLVYVINIPTKCISYFMDDFAYYSWQSKQVKQKCI
jgi:hypothetical protein